MHAVNGLDAFCQLFIGHQRLLVSKRNPQIADPFEHGMSVRIGGSVQGTLAISGLLPRIDSYHISASITPPWTLYGTVGVGGATALLTMVSGWLFAHFGPTGFWGMALLCCAALPVIWSLQRALSDAGGPP